MIATKLATNLESINDYVRKTLLSHLIDSKELIDMVRETLQGLVETGLIKNDCHLLEATILGQAIVASSLTPEDGIFVHKELRKALAAFVMDGEMHVLYAFTPVQSAEGNINWQLLRKEVDAFDDSNMRALSFVGLKPSIINKMSVFLLFKSTCLHLYRAQGGTMKESTPEEVETARVYRRFYTALQLRDLCSEMPIHAVARKYDLPRGKIQNLAQTCQGFAAGMIKFCERMNWGALAVVLDHFSDRLKAGKYHAYTVEYSVHRGRTMLIHMLGAKTDLLSLAQITYIKSRTARVFWENGFKTVGSLAAADAKDILPVLLLV